MRSRTCHRIRTVRRHHFITCTTGVPFHTDFKPAIMEEDDACLVVFAKRGKLPEDVLNVVFAFLVDAQSICNIISSKYVVQLEIGIMILCINGR